jgi:hypothetical protein
VGKWERKVFGEGGILYKLRLAYDKLRLVEERQQRVDHLLKRVLQVCRRGGCTGRSRSCCSGSAGEECITTVNSYIMHLGSCRQGVIGL